MEAVLEADGAVERHLDQLRAAAGDSPLVQLIVAQRARGFAAMEAKRQAGLVGAPAVVDQKWAATVRRMNRTWKPGDDVRLPERFRLHFAPVTQRAPVGSSVATPREHRSAQATRNKSPGSEGSDRPPLAPRPCDCCGETFTPARRKQTYCLRSDCRRAYEAARKASQRRRKPQPSILDRYREEVWKARDRRILTSDEAIELLIAPSETVLRRLERQAA